MSVPVRSPADDPAHDWPVIGPTPRWFGWLRGVIAAVTLGLLALALWGGPRSAGAVVFWALGVTVLVAGLVWLVVVFLRDPGRLARGGADGRPRARRRAWRRELLAGRPPDDDDRRLLAATVARWEWWRSIGPFFTAQVGGQLVQVDLDAPLSLMVPAMFGILLVTAGVARLDAAPLLRLARRIGAVPVRGDTAGCPLDA